MREILFVISGDMGFEVDGGCGSVLIVPCDVG